MPLVVEEIRGELSLHFERLNTSSFCNSHEGKVLEEQALFSGQFKGKCQNCGQLGHSGGKNGNSSSGFFSSYFLRRGTASSCKKRDDTTIPVVKTVVVTDKQRVTKCRIRCYFETQK
jgi:hypothetical protein